jgi:hypothetical protein
MARRRERPRVEDPAWVRCFNLDDWRDPADDARWPAYTLDWHAECRWVRTRNGYWREHPDSADQALADLLGRLGAPVHGTP